MRYHRSTRLITRRRFALDAFSPREVQSRVRAGASVDVVAAETGWPVDKVERYAEPVLGERAYVAQQAQAAEIRRSGGAVSLLESVRAAQGLADDDSGQWDAFRREDGRWVVTARSGNERASWTYDATGRSVHPLDDTARAWMGVAPAADPIEDALGLIAETPVVRADAEVETLAPERPRLVAVPSLDVSKLPDEQFPDEQFTDDQYAVGDEVLEYDEVEVDDIRIESGDETVVVTATTQTVVIAVEQPSLESSGLVVDEPVAKQRKPKARRSRASVPSWDEILFGTQKPED